MVLWSDDLKLNYKVKRTERWKTFLMTAHGDKSSLKSQRRCVDTVNSSSSCLVFPDFSF